MSTHPFLSLQDRFQAFPEISAEDLARCSLAQFLRIAAGAESDRDSREGEITRALDAFMTRVAGSRRAPGAVAVPLEIGAALDGGTSGAGQELVFTRPGTFINGLRARSVTGSLGATVQQVPLPTTEPRLDADVTVSWVGEDPGSDLADTEPTLGSVAYTLHTLACTVPYSRQLLAQSFGLNGIDQVVARSAQGAMGAEIDRVAVQGSGASNEPTGLLNTAGIGSVAIGTNGGAPTYAHVVDLEHEVAVDDADAGRLGFATTPGMRKKLRQVEKAAGSGLVWDDRRVLGYPAAVSRNVPSNLTKGTGTNLHALIFGNWADLVISLLPVMDVVVDPFTMKDRGLVEVMYFLYLDVKVRRAESFAAVLDADPTA